MVESLDRRETG